MAIIDDLLTLYHQHFGPQAYSRATHAPITFGNLPAGIDAQTDRDTGAITMQAALRQAAEQSGDDKTFFNPILRHENLHVLQVREKPAYNMSGIKDNLLPLLKNGLKIIGYSPNDIPNDEDAVNEGLSYFAQRGTMPGLNPRQSYEFVQKVAPPGGFSPQMQSLLNKRPLLLPTEARYTLDPQMLMGLVSAGLAK